MKTQSMFELQEKRKQEHGTFRQGTFNHNTKQLHAQTYKKNSLNTQMVLKWKTELMNTVYIHEITTQKENQ